MTMFAHQRPKDIDPLLLSPRQACRALAISERTLWARTRSGEIPHIRIGKLVRYSVDGLKKYIEIWAEASWNAYLEENEGRFKEATEELGGRIVL